MSLFAAATPQNALLVLSKGDHTLSIVDPSTLKAIARMPVGEDPHEVIASTDGKVAYASNYGGGRYHSLAVLDLINQKALPSIDLGPLAGPHGLTFVDNQVWFTAEAAKCIGRYDPATLKVDWILGTGQNRTHMIFVFPDLSRIVTSNISSATMSLIDRVSESGQRRSPVPDWNQTVVPVGKGAEGFDVSPDGKELWAANAGDGTVSIISLAEKKVIETLPAKVEGANRLKFTPDGKHVLISTLRGPDLVILDAATRRDAKRLPIGHGAAGIQMQPDGARAFVSCTPDNYVAVIDLSTLKVVGHLEAGREPDGLAWAVRH
jgi:YVTN family beta-propeller protein